MTLLCCSCPHASLSRLELISRIVLRSYLFVNTSQTCKYAPPTSNFSSRSLSMSTSNVNRDRLFFFFCRLTMFYYALEPVSLIGVRTATPTCSTVSFIKYRKMTTSFFWPMRRARATACCSTEGFHCGSTMWTRLATVRFSLFSGQRCHSLSA